MNYRIMGANGQMYGPAGLELIRQWLAEGRVDNRTPVLVEGTTAWTYLGLLPEFSGANAIAQPAMAQAVTAMAPAPDHNGFATAGFIFSLLAWTCCCCGLPFSLLGLIFSIIALLQINSQAHPQSGRGLAIAGLVLSAASLFLGIAAFIWQLAFGATTFNWQIH